MREDYSENGDAWNYFSHDQARSRAYRWGEDGLGGICDEKQRLCFALVLWNERDPILKECLFGLTNSEGNHGEDVKEYYLILFYEYFHGDNGAGLGASHQTGWTGLIAPLLDLFGRLEGKSFLETDRGQILARLITEQVGGEGRIDKDRVSRAG